MNEDRTHLSKNQQASMTILSVASRLFRERRYEEALAAYRQVKGTYSLQSIDGLIELCASKVSRSGTPAPVTLDPITAYLLRDRGADATAGTSQDLLLAEIQRQFQRRSSQAAVREVKARPAEWPADLELAPLPESTNDFTWMLQRRREEAAQDVGNAALSVIVPTYNRSSILAITLACLANQKTTYPFEVIVADDGSIEDIQSVVRAFESRLDVKHIRHADTGYKLCAIRNFGIRAARHEWVALLDCDMAPGRDWVQSYCELLSVSDQWALIGPRKYIDTSAMGPEAFLHEPEILGRLPEVVTNNSVAGRSNGTASVDWRLEHFRKTEGLRLCDSPFRYFSGGNVAFSRRWIRKIGDFDEDFTAWGGEDNEFAYRLYRSGCFFRYVDGALAYHQEPPGKENETDREMGHKITRAMVMDRVPYPYRRITPITSAKLHKVPLVSIYIPAYNAEEHIERAVESALMQTVHDLEVCICDDGSTDRTPDILKRQYRGHPRVRYVSQNNGGIGKASNTAVRMARGFYVGQLDSDDYLNPDAVELCLKELLADPKLACAYTTNDNLVASTGDRQPGYNWPEFSREKLTCAMIVHHFRMFTARAWNLTTGFAEDLKNAVDYDMYLKLSEVGPFKHVNVSAYTRVLHGDNTSIRASEAQKTNHFIAVNRSFERQRIAHYRIESADASDVVNRAMRFIPLASQEGVASDASSVVFREGLLRARDVRAV